MKNKPAYKEPDSTPLRRHAHGDKTEIVNTVRWIAIISVALFSVLIGLYLSSENYINAVAVSIGMLPIAYAIILLRQNEVSVPSMILAVTIILLITWLATFSQGIYDIGILGYPVILIVAGLILRGRLILYLTLLIITCMAWLVFGDVFNIYEPIYATITIAEDFFIGSIIILVAGNAVFRLVRNVYHSLTKAEKEIMIREKAEREREEVIQQLKRKNRELDRFAIRVSHDLKTPLITLAGFLGYLEKDINNGDYERAKKDFSQINDSAKMMGKFVDELLDLSRVGRLTNPPSDVSFDEIVRDALKAIDGPLRSKQVQVEIDPVLPIVHVDRARIVQVMQNLIANAVKFMGPQRNPIIRIGVEKINGEPVFFVQDNGIGISEEHHKNIFELFNKLDSDMEGTGLGLGLVKKIIEVHKGKIWVESEVDKGATFFFTLENKYQEETV